MNATEAQAEINGFTLTRPYAVGFFREVAALVFQLYPDGAYLAIHHQEGEQGLAEEWILEWWADHTRFALFVHHDYTFLLYVLSEKDMSLPPLIDLEGFIWGSDAKDNVDRSLRKLKES